MILHISVDLIVSSCIIIYSSMHIVQFFFRGCPFPVLPSGVITFFLFLLMNCDNKTINQSSKQYDLHSRLVALFVDQDDDLVEVVVFTSVAISRNSKVTFLC